MTTSKRTSPKLSDDAQEFLGWLDEGYYDDENDLVAIVDAVSLRFANLFNADWHAIGSDVEDVAFLSTYRRWWITTRRHLHDTYSGGDTLFLPYLGTTELAEYAKLVETGEDVLVFRSLIYKHPESKQPIVPTYIPSVSDELQQLSFLPIAALIGVKRPSAYAQQPQQLVPLAAEKPAEATKKRRVVVRRSKAQEAVTEPRTASRGKSTDTGSRTAATKRKVTVKRGPGTAKATEAQPTTRKKR